MASDPFFQREFPVTIGIRELLVEKRVNQSTKSRSRVIHWHQPGSDDCLKLSQLYRWADGVTFAFSLPHWNFNPNRMLVGKLTYPMGAMC